MNLSVSPAINALNAELRAADESLVNNEDILRAVLSGCGDCIKILDLAGRLQFMSEGGKRVMEVDNFSSLKGCPWPDFWAGNGNAEAKKSVEAARQGQTARFKGSADTAKGTAKYWDVQVSPIFGLDGCITHLLSISRDITAEWMAENVLKEASERQRLLSLEMNHRVRNTISIISAVASQTIRGTDIEIARSKFIARLNTLADANRLLLQDEWESASIQEVVERALAPHDPGPNRIQVNGPSIELPPKKALSLALALHELATNATKYGALSNGIGIVHVDWKTDSSISKNELVLRWQESKGPSINTDELRRKGFGSRLINDVLSRDFGGEVSIDYAPNGAIVELRAPFPM